MNFKIPISQLIAKIVLKIRSLNNVKHLLIGHIQIWHFLSKNIKVFQ